MKEQQQGNEEDSREYKKFEMEARHEIEDNARNIEKLSNQAPPHEESAEMPKYFFFYRKLLAIKQKNDDLKGQLSEYRFDRNWKGFMTHFKDYMNDLMAGFKNLVSGSSA